MTWPTTENFDSYTEDATIDGGAGGTGWAGNWIGSATNEAITPAAPTGMSGKALKILWVSGDGGSASRQLSSINPTTSGETIFEYKFMAEQTNKSGYAALGLYGVAGRAGVHFQTDGHIYNLYGTITDLGAYTANTVYTIKIKFGHASGKYAISIDGGAYSSDFDLGGSTPWTIDAVQSANANVSTASFWIDDIKDGATSDPAPSVSDTVTVTEDVGINPSIPLKSDSVTVSENVQISLSLPSPIIDSVTVTDVPTILIVSLVPSVFDSVTVTENVRIDLSIPLIFDSVTVTENIQLNPSIPLISDSVTVSENVTISYTLPNPVSDTITVTDVPTILIPSEFPSVFDTVSVTESVSFTILDASFSVNVSDSVTITESVQVVESYVISVFETITTTENVLVVIKTLFFLVFDSISSTESISAFIPTVLPSVFDTIVLSENLTVRTVLEPKVNDIVTATENVQMEYTTWSTDIPSRRPYGGIEVESFIGEVFEY